MWRHSKSTTIFFSSCQAKQQKKAAAAKSSSTSTEETTAWHDDIIEIKINLQNIYDSVRILQHFHHQQYNNSLSNPPRIMPLVKIFARQTLTKSIPLTRLQTKLCSIWKTKPSTTKLILFRVDDWTNDSFHEDVYVDIRAYDKPERTRAYVLDGMNDVQSAFSEEGLVANVRLETYNGEQYFHVPPSSTT